MRTRTLFALAVVAAIATTGPMEAKAERGHAGVEFRYGSININNPLFAFLVGDDDISLIALELYANTEVAPGFTLGGRLPLAHARFDDDAQTSLGNLTLELRYELRNALRARSWIESGISVGTADDDGEGAQVALAHGIFWIPDPGLYLPNTNTFRFMYRHEWSLRPSTQAKRGLAVNVGAGAHFLSIDDAEDRLRVPIQVTGLLGLSAQAEVMGRFGTYWTSGAEDDEDSFLHTLEAGLRLAGVGQGELEILVYVPLDDTYRDLLEAWGISVGFRSGF